MVERKPSLTRRVLQKRKSAKRKKPEFDRSESWRYSKLKRSWRRPRGLDHKMRRKIKGWPPTVSSGYKGPKIARGLHPSGFREVLVYNEHNVAAIDPKTQAARIAHTVGRKKRGQIIAEARKKKIIVLNAKEFKEKATEIEAKTEETDQKTVKDQEKSEKKVGQLKHRRGAPKKQEKSEQESPTEKPKRTRKGSKNIQGAKQP